MRVVIDRIDIPDFGGPDTIPVLPPEIYEGRLRRFVERLKEEQLDAAAVYADREHSANMAYLTGFDPRFEEALFVVLADGRRTLIVGNECLGVLGDLPVKADIRLCQEFSLMGQDRSRSWNLAPLLKKAGLRDEMRIGVLGWKSLEAGRIEIPAYIRSLLQEITFLPLVNANSILMHEETGLRIRNEPEQIAAFEHAAVLTSRSVRTTLRALRPGIREFEAARHLQADGQPLSCHTMCVFGHSIANGMASPGNTRLEEGHRVTMALGVWGSLTCRAGLAVRNEKSFPGAHGGLHRKVIDNYLAVTRAWYASLGVKASAGDVWRAADITRNKRLYRFCVNTGHYIHLDEWVCSPFRKDGRGILPSSSAIQADIIPVGIPGPVTVNMEDGVVLANANLRRELKRHFPALLARCEARRKFMTDTLGYEIGDDVLPLGNMPGAYFPFLLDTGFVCRFKK